MTRKEQSRNPGVMIVASLILLGGLALVVVGILNLSTLGWFSWILIIGGLSSVGLATMTLVTGKAEWILIDLILPG